jgi:NAD(P)-dependent dehydrogenase (short-subunit alcohol dehydrogenase family)
MQLNGNDDPMSTKLKEEVILITGVSTGIGRATADLLARKGYKVFGGIRSPERVQPIAGVELLTLDVRDDASVKACVNELLRVGGRIDVLVNNAGYSIVGAVEETTIEQAQGLFDTNVFGALRTIAQLGSLASPRFTRIYSTSFGTAPGAM